MSKAKNLGAYSTLKYDLTGQTFGRLKVIARAPNGVDTQWVCLCVCGNTAIATSGALRYGRTVSCGCRGAEARTENGKANTGPRQQHKQAYKHWASMIKRCYRTYDVNYERYGAAGIRVCERWRTFGEFVADNGDPPAGTSIDRIQTSGHYSCGNCDECIRNDWPMNCRWATIVQQQRNRSSNRLVTLQGETRCVSEWCEILRLNRNAVYARLHQGWDMDKALLTPIRPKKQKAPAAIARSGA